MAMQRLNANIIVLLPIETGERLSMKMKTATTYIFGNGPSGKQ
jgi:hypothetical protein